MAVRRSDEDALTTPDRRWYARLFDQLGRRYQDLPFTGGTEQEVAFLVEELGLVAGERAIDVGCGPARHAVELAARGLTVTGVDLSLRQLELGLAKARERDVIINLVHADAREIPYHGSFDVALSLCEGAFGLLESAEEDRRVLERMRRALKPGGRLALNALSRAYLEARREQFPGYDPDTGYTDSAEEMVLESGRSLVVHYRDRAFSPEELTREVEAAGFAVRAVHGARYGEFGRRPAGSEWQELLLIGEAR